jgi:hypothetical protein
MSGIGMPLKLNLVHHHQPHLKETKAAERPMEQWLGEEHKHGPGSGDPSPPLTEEELDELFGQWEKRKSQVSIESENDQQKQQEVSYI